MKKVVYILGSTRSGSTMLDLIISAHPDCATVGELCLLHKRKCGLCGADCERWAKFREVFDGKKYYKAAFEAFGVDTIVDSSKKWRWFLERAKNEKLDYRVIHLVRNGLDRLKTKKRIEGFIHKRIVQAWVNTHRQCEEVRKKYNGILVKYEDLHKPKTLGMICSFTGIDYREDMCDFWKVKHHGLLGSKTAYSLVRSYHGASGKHMEFKDEHGFNLTPRLGHEFLDAKDIKTFKDHGGSKLNRKLGYE